jgi:hypothetical protein
VAKDSGGDGHGGLSDEEWAAFEKQFTTEATKSAAYKEPSARQRELTAKWKAEPPKNTGWRTDGPAPILSAAAERPRVAAVKKRSKWRSIRRTVTWIVVTILVVGAVVELPNLMKGKPAAATTPNNGEVFGATPSASGSGAVPAGGGGAATSSAESDDQYFDGSPSIGWANGAAGIDAGMKPAAAVGNYSETTVANAEAALKAMLVDANLDPHVLTGTEPSALFALTDPKEGVKALYDAAVAKPSAEADPTWWVARFDPKKVQVLGHEVKVNGTMTAAVNTQGDLIITSDYSFVYALGLTDGSEAQDRSLVNRQWQLDISPYDSRSDTYWLLWGGDGISNDMCNMYNGYINPSFGAGGLGENGKSVDPYATTPPPINFSAPSTPSASASSGAGECDSVSGTI